MSVRLSVRSRVAGRREIRQSAGNGRELRALYIGADVEHLHVRFVFHFVFVFFSEGGKAILRKRGGRIVGDASRNAGWGLPGVGGAGEVRTSRLARRPAGGVQGPREVKTEEGGLGGVGLVT